MKRHWMIGATIGVCCWPVGAPVLAQNQELAASIRRAPDGVVRLAFAPRPDVCGDGATMIRFRDRESYMRVSRDDGDSGRRWVRRCIDGPARVSLSVRGGVVRRARVYVGGSWDRTADRGRTVTDLGMVGAPEASRALLELARRSVTDAGDDLVFPAVLADSVETWPVLLTLARDDQANHKARKSAIFWLSQEAGEAVAGELGDFVEDDDEDRDLREHAVFALSQLPREQGVPALIRAARTNRDPAIRRKALFWLGQSEDPRALALFEEILIRQE